MARLPDLVRDSQLEAQFLDGCTIYTSYKFDPTSRLRVTTRKETWKQLQQVGGGGFGSIWLEECIKGGPKGSLRAVKKISIRQNSLDDASCRRELEAITKFSHHRYEHCFVKSFGWYQCPGSLCIAMEYCELGDLQAHLSSTDRLREEEAREVTFQIVEGIRYMHNNNYAHRDLKPGNILIRSHPPHQWWVKIADFGISKRIEESLGAPSTVKGTPDFMAPEQLLGLTPQPNNNSLASIEPYAADIWALGAITFIMLTKRVAFPSIYQLIVYVQDTQPFPRNVLESHKVSNHGQHFIISSMLHVAELRLTAEQAWNHEWIAQCKPSHAVSSKRKAEPETMSSVSSLTDQFATWASVSPLPPHQDEPESPFMASEQNSQLQLQNFPQPSLCQESKLNVETCAFSPESAHTSPYSQELSTTEVHISKAKTEFTLLQTLTGSQWPILSVVFSSDSRRLASSSAAWRYPIKLWDTASGAILHKLQSHNVLQKMMQLAFRGRTSVLGTVFSADGSRLASGHGRLETGHERLESGHERLESGHERLESGHKQLPIDYDVKLWDAITGSLLRTLKYHDSSVNSVVFSPDSNRLASGSDDVTISLWNAVTGSHLLRLRGHEAGVTTVAFSANGIWLASSSKDKTIRLWDAVTGAKIQTINGHASSITSVVFSPDSNHLASGSDGGTIKLWDVLSGSYLGSFTGHEGKVSSVAFSTDGMCLASGSFDKTVRLWDIATRSVFQQLEGHKGAISSVTFSPDGKRLASASCYGVIRLWKTG